MKTLLVLLSVTILAVAQVGYFVPVGAYKQQYTEYPLVLSIEFSPVCFGVWNPYDYTTTVILKNAAGTYTRNFSIDGNNCAPWGYAVDTWVCPTTQDISASINTADTYHVELDRPLAESCGYTNPTFQIADPSWSRSITFGLSSANTYFVGQKFVITNLGSGNTLFGPLTFTLRYDSSGYTVETRVVDYIYEAMTGGVSTCFYMNYKLSSNGPYTVEFNPGNYYTGSARSSAFTYRECNESTDCQSNDCSTIISDWYCNYSAPYTTNYCWDMYGINNSRCFVATASYGSAFSGELSVLRGFRDNVLAESTLGMNFVKLYYKYGPSLADFIEGSETKMFLARIFLNPFVWTIRYPVIVMLSLTIVPFTTLLLVSYLGKLVA